MPIKKTEKFKKEKLARAAAGLMEVANQLQAVADRMEESDIKSLDLAFSVNFREGARRVSVFVGSAHQELANKLLELESE